jgi:hypothetical protein
MPSSKKHHLNLLRDFAAGVYLSEAPSPPMTFPLYTLYTSTLYTVLVHTGKGGRRANQKKRLEGQQFTKIPT